MPAGDSSLCVASQLISFGTVSANWLACRALSGQASRVRGEGRHSSLGEAPHSAGRNIGGALRPLKRA